MKSFVLLPTSHPNFIVIDLNASLGINTSLDLKASMDPYTVDREKSSQSWRNIASNDYN